MAFWNRDKGRQRQETSDWSSSGFDPQEEFQQRVRRRWVLFFWISLAILALFYVLDIQRQPERSNLTYGQFLQAVDSGHVEAVTLRGQRIEGRLSQAGREALEAATSETFETVRPTLAGEPLLQRLEAQGITITAEPTEAPWWQRILVGALPWILILGLLLWFWGRMQQRMMSGGGPFGLGQSKAKKIQREDTDARLVDVAGSENAKQEITEVIDFLKQPSRFHALGAKIPHGILMMGPPGTGKTLMARAVAGEANVPFFSISGSEFIEMFVGVGASRVRDLFKQAREQAPAVIFIDELDSIGRSRGAGMGGGHDEREQTLNQILSQMDGFEAEESVVVLAATNRPDVLDPALLRPGRFDRKITFDLPHRKARQAILEVHTKNMPLAEDVNLGHLAEITIGFSGADLANLANEAALYAGRREQQEVDWACFTDARDRLMLGEAREAVLAESERHIIAYHESGHALLAYLLPHADPLEKVTVIPRGRALGATAQTPDEERYNFNEAYLRDRIAVMFGGRLAESLVFGQVSSGAEDDLKQATQLARRMVAHWGMNERIGPASFPQSEQQVFLAKEISQGREHSEATAAIIDEEIRKLLGNIEAQARDLLETHRRHLDDLASALEKQETLEAAEIHRILDNVDR
ncbi:cell division protease FtsH [Modicisalibacter ilicicola DSM 19980]|uniref:ATP-dependent zinc metalloprotease FtsH n=1 Tax=Modicisalibacter ilicicola DSM 19980 TaxID=1121942 RepID=A0A1M4WYK4_9GAMM|nr:ATP-dependent zinc metalloprotease FtsH [Halomonas ilicicola]SHE86143.1 cell division protease FtsH [Halomonas ilicicola DSM 19980]